MNYNCCKENLQGILLVGNKLPLLLIQVKLLSEFHLSKQTENEILSIDDLNLFPQLKLKTKIREGEHIDLYFLLKQLAKIRDDAFKIHG